MEKAEAKLKGVRVVLNDLLTHVQSNVLGRHHDDGCIALSTVQFTDETRSRLRKTIFHEFLHAVSGESVQLITRSANGGPAHRTFHRRKSGVTFLPFNSLDTRFAWLNEAITEWLALRLSSCASDNGRLAYQGSGSYPDERRALDGLFRRGLAESVTIEAYFEDIDETQPRQQQGEKFARLLAGIRSVENDPAAFAKLEHRFVLDDVLDGLTRRFCYAKDQSEAAFSNLPADAKIFRVTVRVGYQDRFSVHDEVFFRTFGVPAADGRRGYTAEEMRERIERSIADEIRSHGPRVSCTIEEMGAGHGTGGHDPDEP